MVAEMLNNYYGERLAPEHMYTPARSLSMSPPTGQSPPTEAIRSRNHLTSDQCYPLVFQRPVWGHEHCMSYLPPRPPAYSPDVMAHSMNNSFPNPHLYHKDPDDKPAHSVYYSPEQRKTSAYIFKHSNERISEETTSSGEGTDRGMVEKSFTRGSVSDSLSPEVTLAFSDNNSQSERQRAEEISEPPCKRRLIQKSRVLVREFPRNKTLSAPNNIPNTPEKILPHGMDNEYNPCSPPLSEKSVGTAISNQNMKGPENPPKQLRIAELPSDLSKTSTASAVIEPQSPGAPFQGSVAAKNALPKGGRKAAAGVKRKASDDQAAEVPERCPKHEDKHVLAPGQSECLLWACKLCKQTAVKAVKRRVATVRERQRVKILNDAYNVLKNVCSCNPDPRQPKLEILQTAIRYIESLKGILHVTAGCDWDNSESRTLNNSTYVNEPFQQYGEKSNLSSCSESSDSSFNVSSLDSLSQIVQRINPNTKSLLTAITKHPEAHER